VGQTHPPEGMVDAIDSPMGEVRSTRCCRSPNSSIRPQCAGGGFGFAPSALGRRLTAKMIRNDAPRSRLDRGGVGVTEFDQTVSRSAARARFRNIGDCVVGGGGGWGVGGGGLGGVGGSGRGDGEKNHRAVLAAGARECQRNIRVTSAGIRRAGSHGIPCASAWRPRLAAASRSRTSRSKQHRSTVRTTKGMPLEDHRDELPSA